MHSLNGTKVTSFRVVEGYHISNVGTLGPGEISCGGMAGVTGSLTLTYVDGGVEVKGSYGPKKQRIRVFIPIGNIKGITLALEEVKLETNNKGTNAKT